MTGWIKKSKPTRIPQYFRGKQNRKALDELVLRSLFFFLFFRSLMCPLVTCRITEASREYIKYAPPNVTRICRTCKIKSRSLKKNNEFHISRPRFAHESRGAHKETGGHEKDTQTQSCEEVKVGIGIRTHTTTVLEMLTHRSFLRHELSHTQRNNRTARFS